MPRFVDERSYYRLSGDEAGKFKGLSVAQAYHLWYLSATKEGGDDFPTAPVDSTLNDLGAASAACGERVPAVRRIFSWFNDETHRRFYEMKRNGITPLQFYEMEDTVELTVELTVRVPNDGRTAMSVVDSLSVAARDGVRVVNRGVKR